MFKQKEFNSKAQKARRLKFDLDYASKMDPEKLIRNYNNATRYLKGIKTREPRVDASKVSAIKQASREENVRDLSFKNSRNMNEIIRQQRSGFHPGIKKKPGHKEKGRVIVNKLDLQCDKIDREYNDLQKQATKASEEGKRLRELSSREVKKKSSEIPHELGHKDGFRKVRTDGKTVWTNKFGQGINAIEESAKDMKRDGKRMIAGVNRVVREKAKEIGPKFKSIVRRIRL